MTPGATILAPEGPALTRDEAAFFRDADPWGFILFRRNILDAEGTRALCAALRDAMGRDAVIFVDQEGGTVQRLRPPLARDWPDASAHRGGVRGAWARHRLMAAELRALGIDGNCAPVIDVAGPATHPFLQRRIWSDDPERVATWARAACAGLLAGGVLPVVKHLPGHGAANSDSHHALARCPDPIERLMTHDFAPVRALADQPLGMTGHMIFDALDPGVPTTHSPVVLGFLRAVLGFQGLLMTDDLSMNALGGALPDRAARALAAGCDVVLHCSGDLAEMQGIAAAAGSLTDAARMRADRALASRQAPQPVDIAALDAELGALTAIA